MKAPKEQQGFRNQIIILHYNIERIHTGAEARESKGCHLTPLGQEIFKFVYIYYDAKESME